MAYAETITIDQVQSILTAREPFVSANPTVQPSLPAVAAKVRFTRQSPVNNFDVLIKLTSVATVVLNTDYSVTGTLAAFAVDADGDLSAYVRFLDGQSQAEIQILPLNDTIVEGVESVLVSIKTELAGVPLPYAAGAPTGIDVAIADNDHRVRLSIQDSLADEDVNLLGLPNDPDIQRRAIFQARFDPFTGPVVFDRNVSLQFTSVGNIEPLAILNTDYQISYKICGNNTATANSSRIGYNKISASTQSTGVGYMLVAYLPGATTIRFTGASDDDSSFPPGSIVRFDNHSSQYEVQTSGKDSFTIDATPASGASSPALTYPLPNGTGMSVEFPTAGDPPQNLTVSRTYSAGSTTINVAFGSGGLFRGDVFQIPDDDSFYVVTTDTAGGSVASNSSGVLTFRRYQGPGISDGLAADLGGTPILVTRISPTSELNGMTLNLLVPEESTKVEVAVAPTLAPDGIEGVEEIRVRVKADDNYMAVTPQEESVYIADRDVTASVEVQSNAGLPSQAGYFKIKMSDKFNRTVRVPYSITDTTGTVPSQYDTAMPDFVDFAPGQTEALILVNPIVATSVTLTLSGSRSYSTAGSSDGRLNPSATMDISSKIGNVSIAAAVNSTIESASPTDGRFVVTLSRTTNSALGVNLTVGGSASTARYQLINDLTGLPYTITNNIIQVSIPAGAANTTATIRVHPIDDDRMDSDQSVQLSIAPGQAYDAQSPTSATVTIIEDEPTVTISSTRNGARPTTPGFFYLSLSQAASQPVTVNFTYTGTGVQNDDYVAVNTITFAAGTTVLPVQVNPVDDPEGADFTVTLNVTSSTKHGGTPSGTISIGNVATIDSKPTPGSIDSGSSSGGCGLGSGVASLVLSFVLLGLWALHLRKQVR